jgi:catechol-2,3-dioxygenase
MKITNLKLYTNNLDLEKEFYTKTLGFELISESLNHFTIKIGWSKLTFEKSKKEHKYHYCFLIPSNKLNEGMEWLQKRIDIVAIDNGRKTQVFESWNAESFYFFDKSGNLAEFIVRYDLKNESVANFDTSQVLGVNEIGLPSKNVAETNRVLEKELKTKFWKGDPERFGTNGTQEGLILLPNYEMKDIWFPTSLKIQPEPFLAIIENDGNKYCLEFKNEEINIKSAS